MSEEFIYWSSDLQLFFQIVGFRKQCA